MDSERVNEIRARVSNDYGATDESVGTWLRARYDTQIRADIECLLAERDRLQAVVAAARGFLSDGIYTSLVDHPMDWADESGDIDRLTALRDALAAYDASEGGGE